MDVDVIRRKMFAVCNCIQYKIPKRNIKAKSKKSHYALPCCGILFYACSALIFTKPQLNYVNVL